MRKAKLRIRELREDRGLTQAQLAKEIGYSPNTLSQYETGVFEPNIDTIKKLCEFFGVTADYLLDMED